jgi:anti-sigma factor RsiW
MSLPPADITEDDLHAYVDNRLDGVRLAAVERFLSTHPEDAARVEAYRFQRAALRAALAAVDGQAVPPRLNPWLLLERRQWRKGLLWRSAAAVVLALGLGGGGGWALRGVLFPPETQVATLVRDAVANHVVYTADRRRPTELGAEQRDDLARWVSNRLNHKIAPPDLSDCGYRYLGGRLAATPEGPAGMFMYQNDAGMRMTVFVRPDKKARDAPLSPVLAGSMGGAGWINNGVGYSVVAPISAQELLRLADEVRRALEAPA